jgi:hypothetical protein
MQMQNVNGVIEQLHLHRSLFMDHLGFLNRNFGDFYTGRDMRRVRWLRSFFLMAQPSLTLEAGTMHRKTGFRCANLLEPASGLILRPRPFSNSASLRPPYSLSSFTTRGQTVH